jgi:outer membrane protein OmpU
MNNLKKIGLSALAGSLATFSATAADFSVTGGAALYFDDPNRGSGSKGNSFYMGDSLKFNASGETDGGLTVGVYYELDNDIVDDFDMNVGGDWGTLAFFGSGGSTALGAVDDVMPNAYEEAWDVIDTDGAATSGSPHTIGGGSGANMFKYTSPSFSGATLTVAYVDGSNSDAIEDSYMDFAIAVSPEAVEGLTLGYASSDNNAGVGVDNDKSTMYAKYAVGGFTLGYQISDQDHDTASLDREATIYGVSYAVNDDFSIAYTSHTMDYDAAKTTNNSDQESTGISASYTMGGMTLAGSMNEVDNMQGTATKDFEGYEFSLSFAF